MHKFIGRSFVLLSFAVSLAFGQVPEVNDGEVRKNSDLQLEAWDADGVKWVALDEFWARYAARSGGLTWGKRADYPPYKEVQELDTMIIELDSGTCMMMFFHMRWRRANDVRRWDNAFNEYSACPYVFD